MASGDASATTDTTREFLRSFSVIDVDSESESDFDELSPIPENPGDHLDDAGDGLPESGDLMSGAASFLLKIEYQKQVLP
ncbi:hypothetical protein ElyMa_004878700 [Elysia marginata]|uniref:CTNNB1 binding N-teminal domain-containing protein n=1 Tax=Elysia marginata TaxID=1093978 RepID=A0AAV4ISB6_9GAST|nr:hypothetical protein ElyMa_004878700 [Elysia marginata]